MVSKQDKYLSQQAIPHAEKCKDDQAKKIASHVSAKNTTGMSNRSISMSSAANN
jgi:hypothetical protein